MRVLIAGDSKKNARRLTGKSLENVTVVAPKPADYPADHREEVHPYAQTPWLDVTIESAHVWGCFERWQGGPARFTNAGMPAMRPLLDLIATA